MLHSESRLDFDSWHAAISEDFVPLDAIPAPVSRLRGRKFVGGLSSTRMGEITLSEVSGDSVEVARTRATIRRGDPGLVKLGLQLKGTGVVSQAGREVVLRPGDFTVYDTADSYRLRFDGEFRMFVVMVSRDALHVDEKSLCTNLVRRVSPTDTMGTVLTPFLFGLHRSSRTDQLPASSAVERALYDLVGAVIEPNDPLPASHEGVLVLADAFIDAHLNETSLGPGQIAASLHVSVRYLQKLFESDSRTVSGSIRRRRLELCADDFVDPALARHSVSEIGVRNGIADASRLSRQFREMFGMPPRQYRQDATAKSQGTHLRD